MKTAIYLRSSTTKQDKGLDAQRRAIDSFLAQKSIDPSETVVFEDNGYSGAKKNRPSLNALTECIIRGEIERVVCYSFSRISRSIRDLIDIVELFEKNKVKFISLSENVDTSVPMGKCFLNIIGALNQAEREILSERTKNGLKAAKARGKALGRRKTRPSDSIQELAKKGLNQREIAKILRIGKSTVQRELAVHNTPVNPLRVGPQAKDCGPEMRPK